MCNGYTIQARTQEKVRIPRHFSLRIRQLIIYSKIEELEKQVAHLRDTVQQRQHASPSPYIPPPVATSTSRFLGQVLQAPQDHLIAHSIPDGRSNNIYRPEIPVPGAITQDQGQRPLAQAIRAIESTALGREEIDSLFAVYVPQQ